VRYSRCRLRTWLKGAQLAYVVSDIDEPLDGPPPPIGYLSLADLNDTLNGVPRLALRDEARGQDSRREPN
jgi:hypothetical protein